MPGYVFEFTAHGHGMPANSGNFQYKESVKKSFKVTNAMHTLFHSASCLVDQIFSIQFHLGLGVPKSQRQNPPPTHRKPPVAMPLLT